MPTVCEIIGKLKAKGITGYSNKTKGQMLKLLETGNAPKKAGMTKAQIQAAATKALSNMRAAKAKAAAPKATSASGSARRVKAKDTAAGIKQTQSVSSFLHKGQVGGMKATTATVKTKGVAPKKKEAVAPKKKEAVEHQTGLPRSELNKMDFFELMKQLPPTIKSNITKQVKEIGEGDISEKYLSSLPPKELLAKYREFKQKVGYYSKYKKNALYKDSLTLVKEVGKRFGRLPQTVVKTYGRGMDPQFGRGMMKFVTGEKEIYTSMELYDKLIAQRPWDGKGFVATLRMELMKRLGPAQQVSEKVYKKNLAENLRNIEDSRERMDERMFRNYHSANLRTLFDVKKEAVFKSGESRKEDYHSNGRHAERYSSDFDKIRNEYLEGSGLSEADKKRVPKGVY